MLARLLGLLGVASDAAHRCLGLLVPGAATTAHIGRFHLLLLAHLSRKLLHRDTIQSDDVAMIGRRRVLAELLMLI